MKILLFVFFVLISISVQSQISKEKVAADESRYIEIVPRLFSEDERTPFKPRRIPTTDEVKKNPLIVLSNLFMKKLEDEFKISILEDSSLVYASDIQILNHIRNTEVKIDCLPVKFHQIWEFPDSVVNYDFNDISQSLVEMIMKNHLENYFNKSIKFYCKEYFVNNKCYLVAILND